MFANDERGGVAVIFAIALPVLLIGVGGSIETTRAVTYRQRLASAVELSCQQSQLFVNAQKKADYQSGTIKATDTSKTYPTQVADITSRNFSAKSLPQLSPTTSTTDTNVHIETVGQMPLIFGGVLNKTNLNFSKSIDCPVKSTAQTIADNTPPAQLLIAESFEKPDHSVSYNSWDVLGGPNNNNTWHGWTTQNAGIEINGQRELASNTIRFGDFFAELDSDCNTAANRNVSNCHSNSAMSRILNLTVGDYEIRYWYIARQRDASRPGQVICGSKDSDVAWYTVDGQTNRIEVFVEKSGSYNFSYSNMVDVCVQADAWTERVIKFKVTAQSDYRISWRAAGREDTYGGLIDYLRICRNACPAS